MIEFEFYSVVRLVTIYANLAALVSALACYPSWRAQDTTNKVLGLLVIGNAIATSYSMIEQEYLQTPGGPRYMPYMVLSIASAMIFLKILMEQSEFRTIVKEQQRFVAHSRAESRKIMAEFNAAEKAEWAEVGISMEPAKEPEVTNEPTQVANKAQTVKRTTVQSLIANVLGFLVILPIIAAIVQGQFSEFLSPAAVTTIALIVAVSSAIAGSVSLLMANPAVNAWLTQVGLGARAKEVQAKIDEVAQAGTQAPAGEGD